MTHLIGKGRYRGEAYPATGGERGTGGGGGGPLAIGEDSIDPATGGLTLTGSGFQIVPKTAEFFLGVTFPDVTEGQVLEVYYQIAYKPGNTLIGMNVVPIVSFDNGATWQSMTSAAVVWSNLAGDPSESPALPVIYGVIQGSGMVEIPTTGAMLVRLAIAPTYSLGASDYQINSSQGTFCCGMNAKIWPASLFVQGPSIPLGSSPF
jgi:hypothetical protein